MLKINWMVIILGFISTIWSCKEKLSEPIIKPGVYTVHVPSFSEIISYKKNTGRFLSSSKITLELNSDSTFRYGSCNKKVFSAGNWRIQNDSLIFYNEYLHPTKSYYWRKESSRKIYKGFIVFEAYKDTGNKEVSMTTLLERDPTRANANDFFLED
jgi:hypothetical protein